MAGADTAGSGTMELGLAGQTAVVTGAASGMGFAIADALTATGVNVIGVDLNPAIADPATWRGMKAGVQCDISSPESVRALGERLTEWPEIDILINAAGVLKPGTATEVSDEDWDITFDVNVKGPWLMSRMLLPRFLERGSGSIVSIASGVGVRPMPGLAVYGASKAATVALMKAIALDHAAQGIRANAVCPGIVDTPLFRKGLTVPVEEMLARYPMGRFGTTEEIAQLVLYLASPAASYITGAAVSIDGGRTLH